MFEQFIVERLGEEVYVVTTTLYYALLVVVPVVLLVALAKAFVTYNRLRYHYSEGSTLLEVHLPQEIKKSPQAMELMMEVFFQKGGETTFIDRWFLGKTSPWFSLEMVSIEGAVHFFIWTRTPWKAQVMSAIYSQYPSVEIFEVEDYTASIPFDLNKYSMWACEFKLTKPDPYPIKTYIDYEMHKEPAEEEFRIDPLSSTIEFFGSLSEGQHAWLQILVRAHKKTKKTPGKLFKKRDWTDEGKDVIKKITTDAKGKTEEGGIMMNLTKGQNNIIESIERNLGKHAFDCGVRALYIAEKDAFTGVNIPGMIGTLKQFSSEDKNGFAPTRGMVPFDYPWQDYRDIRKNKVLKKMLEAYKLRSYFYAPHRSPSFVLSSEELSTIFHFPGNVVTTPTFSRVKSKKAEAPLNIPR